MRDMKIQRMNHLRIIVCDLAAVNAFFHRLRSGGAEEGELSES